MAEVAGGGARRLWAEVRKYYVLKKMESMYAKEFLTKFPLTGKHNLSTYQTGWLAVMYLGYLASGGSNLEPAYIAGGLDTIMSQVHLGKSLDQAIAANSQGKFSGLKDFEAKFTADNQEVVDFTITLLNTVGQGRGSLLFDSYADDATLCRTNPTTHPCSGCMSAGTPRRTLIIMKSLPNPCSRVVPPLLQESPGPEADNRVRWQHSV